MIKLKLKVSGKWMVCIIIMFINSVQDTQVQRVKACTMSLSPEYNTELSARWVKELICT